MTDPDNVDQFSDFAIASPRVRSHNGTNGVQRLTISANYIQRHLDENLWQRPYGQRVPLLDEDPGSLKGPHVWIIIGIPYVSSHV